MKTVLDREIAYPPRSRVEQHACVQLGRSYFVYEFDSTLVVRQARRRRTHETLERRYDIEDVRALACYYAGRTITAKEALDDIRMGLVQIPTVSYRGHACSDVRDMFIGLCAMGVAKVRNAPGGPAFVVSTGF